MKKETLNGIPLKIDEYLEQFSAALQCVLEEKFGRKLASLGSLTEGSKKIAALSRTVEQLSGRLTSEARRNRQQ